jgi:hypothetical protein
MGFETLSVRLVLIRDQGHLAKQMIVILNEGTESVEGMYLSGELCS